jgi:hypothetical protein
VEELRNILSVESVDQLLTKVYNNINNEIEKYAKKLILDALGITIDSWGAIKDVSPKLREEILNTEELQKVKTNLISAVRKEINIKIDKDIGNVFITKRISNQIITSILHSLDYEVKKSIEANIYNEIIDRYQEQVKEEVYNIPAIKKLNIEKL